MGGRRGRVEVGWGGGWRWDGRHGNSAWRHGAKRRRVGPKLRSSQSIFSVTVQTLKNTLEVTWALKQALQLNGWQGMAGLASDLRSPIGHINIMHQEMPGTSGNVRIGQINTFLGSCDNCWSQERSFLLIINIINNLPWKAYPWSAQICLTGVFATRHFDSASSNMPCLGNMIHYHGLIQVHN